MPANRGYAPIVTPKCLPATVIEALAFNTRSRPLKKNSESLKKIALPNIVFADEYRKGGERKRFVVVDRPEIPSMDFSYAQHYLDGNKPRSRVNRRPSIARP